MNKKTVLVTGASRGIGRAIALALAKEAGNIKAVNVVLIGVLAKNSEIPYEVWIETIKETVPEKFMEVNLKAFDLGYKMA